MECGARQYETDKCVCGFRQTTFLYVAETHSTRQAATSSYVSIPPPYTHVYSAGGPTGEVHVIDPTSGGFGEKVQQILFVKEEDLDGADKSPVALVSNK
jgi:carboxy-cis,cis-muconate cyclase